MKDLQALKELWEKTTPGEYRAFPETDIEIFGMPDTLPARVMCVSYDAQRRRRIQSLAVCNSTLVDNDANAQFFADAHEAWPEILDRLEAAEARVKELETALEPFAEEGRMMILHPAYEAVQQIKGVKTEQLINAAKVLWPTLN